MASINDTAPKVVGAAEKPNKFTGIDFATWKNKMFFYLTTLNLARFLNEDAPKAKEGETPENDKKIFQAIDAWNHSDFLCRNYILNCLDEPLYKVYSPIKNAKLLWENLSKKYKSKDAGYRKFIVDKFQFYRMVDSKTVSEQVNELQLMIYDILAEGHEVSESYQVATIVGKLPPSWTEFKHYLRHKKSVAKWTMEELIARLKTEEDNKITDKGGESVAKAHIAGSSKESNKRKAPTLNNGPNKKNKRFTGPCFVCGKNGLLAKNCRHRKDNNKNEANITMDLAASKSDDMHFSAVVTEAYLMSDTRGWWVDTGATRHICYDKSMFSTYKKLEREQKLFMGNDAHSVVEGQRQVILKFTSGKDVTLNDVLHVPDVRKNLISGSVLTKKGFKLAFESDKFVLTKGGLYVGKGYLCDGLFKANVAVIGRN